MVNQRGCTEIICQHTIDCDAVVNFHTHIATCTWSIFLENKLTNLTIITSSDKKRNDMKVIL